MLFNICNFNNCKGHKDRIMRQWDEIYPQYGFAKHKGYGTAEHIKALKEYGPCPLHRESFIKHFCIKKEERNEHFRYN